MGGYADFNMLSPASEESEVGICHARGSNEGIPPQWLLYVVVADLEQSMERCLALGGKVVREARPLGPGRFCIVQDPAGAVCALYESKP
jgi:predicted enzyme related to lactoylglutathione lyase